MKWSVLLGGMLVLNGYGYAQSPVIYSVDRGNAAPREVVTLQGSDFGTDPSQVRVFFGGTKARIKSISNQLIEVRTPTGATFDPIRVTNIASGRSATAPGQFFLNYQGESGIASTQFSPQSDFQAQSGLYDLCLCDFNDDDKVDVATASNNSTMVTIFQNTSTPGTINLAGQNVVINARTLHVRCGDLNSDGRSDIVLSEASDGSRVFILTNNGSFSFSVQAVTLTGMKVKQLAISDLDLDGRPDVVVTNTGGNGLAILPNTSRVSAVSFGTPLIITMPQASSTDALAVADMNGDGYPEIVTSQYQTDSENKLFIARNQGSFNFSDVKVIQVNKAVSNIRVADLDADGKPDLTLARLTGSDISLYLNNSASNFSFRDPVFFITETLPVGVDFSDFDGDGKLDIAVSSIAKSVSVLKNNTTTPGTSAFAQVVKVNATYINRNLRNADMDGDGKPDIVFTSVDDFSGVPVPSSKVSIVRNLSCMVPKITPGGPLTLCTGTPLQLKATSGGGITYQWQKVGTSNPLKSGQEDFLDVTQAGEYKVVALSGPPTCAKESPIVTVTFATPSVTLSAADADARSNSPVCADNTLQLQVTDVGATEYRWRGPNGFSESSTQIVVQRPGFTMQNAGLYIVEIMAGSCIGRTDSTMVESMTIPDFTISYEGGPNFCAGTAKSLSVVPALSSGFNYQWYEKTGGAIAEATFNTYTASAAGEYYVTVTPNNTGCLPKQTGTVTVATLQQPVVDFQAPEAGCTGEEIAFTQQATGTPGADLVYLWTFGDGQTSGEGSPVKAYTQAQTFQVSLKVAYQGLETCNATASKAIEIFQVVMPEIVASAPAMCEGEHTDLSVAATFSEVKWSTNETEPGIMVTMPGSYHVATVDVHGCQSADEITIEEKEVPQLTASSESGMIAAGQIVQLHATGADDYLWSPGKTLSDSTIADPKASPVQTTTYVVTGSIQDGCSSTAAVVVQVSGEIVNIAVPVLFSPNGDTANETLVIEGAENYPDCSLTIFDKGGGRVFRAAGYQNNWDGTANGTPLPEGVYYYVFGCPNSKAVTGTVTIIR